MAKLGSKREHVRGWTASTFLPDNDSTSTLDAISENAMDEDLPQDDDTAQIISASSISNNSIPRIDEEIDGSGSEDINSDSDNDEDYDDDDDDDESNSSQDQGTSEESDDEQENAVDQEDESSGSSARIGVPKRSRTGVTSKKKRAGSFSTSPNSSKLISATPSKKITKKSKKSVKSKSSKGSLSSSAARQATEEAKLEAAKPIVSRFLELENTKLNDKLLQVFMINGMISYVVESITRLDPEIAKSYSNGMDDDANRETKFMTHVKQCHRTRDYSDLNLMKRSYTAMNFITRNDVYNEFILSSSHQAIVKELFKIFRPESNGNFHHFQKVFETILKKFRAQTMATLFEDTDSESGVAKLPLIFEMLPFLDQMPVALSMTKVLFPTYTYGFAEKINDYYRVLQNGHFMEMLLAMVTLTDDPSPSMADFVVLLLDEATKARDAKVIFSCLADDPIWAERLTEGVKSTSDIKRHGCIEIIYSILVRRYLAEKGLAWSKFNNAFHVQFYKLFRVVLYSEQLEVYERFFVKPNLTARLIEHFKATGQPTGSRGYIILILNCIRLSADVEMRNKSNESGNSPSEAQKGTIPRTFWTDVLCSIPEWEDFQKTLREATLEQTRDTLCDMDPNLRFQFAPLQSRQPSEAPLTRRHTGIPGVSARGNDGVDLGSQCKRNDANSLGFGVPMVYDRAADEESKKQSEQDHELLVQKALANLMPNVDWKLIPPQRVLNAMLGMNKGITGGNSKQETNGNGSGTKEQPGEGNSKGSGSNNDGGASTSSKSKKKKKNKKKRQINVEDANAEGNNFEGQSSKSNLSESENDEKADTLDRDEEGTSGETNGNGKDDDKATAVDSDEERREQRRKEKKKEKKRKNKMNKKNKTLAESQSSDSR
ncbi:hypothetical protein BGZ49_009951 [Haplosporangium sp. Z 27]|nr:hypothetical protein BGZ49_009951 [Haplosporangium sp. Z 27]